MMDLLVGFRLFKRSVHVFLYTGATVFHLGNLVDTIHCYYHNAFLTAQS